MAGGRFDNVGGALLPFSRLTVIYAENGRGKTTLAAILRFVLQTGTCGVIELVEMCPRGAPCRR
jgi:wobble nucleotide-excising tRNase